MSWQKLALLGVQFPEDLVDHMLVGQRLRVLFGVHVSRRRPTRLCAHLALPPSALHNHGVNNGDTTSRIRHVSIMAATAERSVTPIAKWEE